MKINRQLIVLAAAACLLLTACSSGKKEVSVNVQELAGQLNSETVTGDQLDQTAENMIPAIYYLDADQVAAASAYMSGGATASEVAVIESKESGNTKAVEDKLKERVASQSKLYESYNAEEVSRLDTAIIKSAGKYTVLVVCDDTKKAEEILKNAGF